MDNVAAKLPALPPVGLRANSSPPGWMGQAASQRFVSINNVELQMGNLELEQSQCGCEILKSNARQNSRERRRRRGILMGGESEAPQSMMTKTMEGQLCHCRHRDNSTTSKFGFKAGFQITAGCSFHSTAYSYRWLRSIPVTEGECDERWDYFFLALTRSTAFGAINAASYGTSE